MKRGISIVMVVAMITSIVISLFTALAPLHILLVESFIVVLAAAVLYGIFSLFYRSISMMGDGGDIGWHGFFMLLGFLTLPLLLVLSQNVQWFVKSELLFSHPDIVPALVELEMDENSYMAEMPMKKVATIIISQISDSSWNAPASLLKDAKLSRRSLRELVPYNDFPDKKKIDILFSRGDTQLFIETAQTVSATVDRISDDILNPQKVQKERCGLGESMKATKVCTLLQKQNISPTRAVVRTILRTVIYPLQTTFFALLLFYLLVSIMTLKTDKKTVIILFLSTTLLSLLTQLPVVLSPPIHHAMRTLEEILLLPTISVFRAVLLSSGAAFLLYLFYVLYIVIRGRAQ